MNVQEELPGLREPTKLHELEELMDATSTKGLQMLMEEEVEGAQGEKRIEVSAQAEEVVGAARAGEAS